MNDRPYKIIAITFRKRSPVHISRYSSSPPIKAPKRLLAKAILGDSTTAKAFAKISAAKKIGNPIIIPPNTMRIFHSNPFNS